MRYLLSGIRFLLGGIRFGTGSAKGVMLALVIELLVTAFTGARFGFETDSFFDVEGNKPRIGQAFLVINPGAMSGAAGAAGSSDTYIERVETLITAMLEDEGVRLPGARRYELQRKAETAGVNVPDATLAQISALAA